MTSKKFQSYDVFIYLTSVLIILGVFKGYLLFFYALLTCTIALIYHVFYKKGFVVKPIYVFSHLGLTIILIYITYFSFQLLINNLLQILNKQGPNIEQIKSLFWPIIISFIVGVVSIVVFITGLYKSKLANQ